ncbi:MAG: hypothetical protein PHN80_16145 [Hespellia sp.]|nr:hypothetical protein [Hespellia sp.]
MKPKKNKYSDKGVKAAFKLQQKFLLTILLLAAVVFTLAILTEPGHAIGSVIGLGSTSFASMAFLTNVGDQGDKHTTGKNIAALVYLIPIKQVDTSQPFPVPNSAREVSTIPMKEGEYMTYFEAHTPPTFLGNAEKGDITTTGTNTFSIVMAGNRDDLLNFAEEYAGDAFIILFKEVESSQWYILGSYERPVRLKSFENKNDNDGRYISFTFNRDSVKQYYKYTGSLVTIAPATHTAGATALAITSGQGVYSIPNGSSATYAIATVTGLTDNDKGRVITLLGTGTDKAATIADNTAFVLEDGATWTAKAGSRISFRVLDPATLIEVQGSRVQTA